MQGIGSAPHALDFVTFPLATIVPAHVSNYLNNTGFTPGQKIFLIGTLAATAGFATWGIIHIHNLQNQKLTPPTPPTPPFP